MFFSCSDGSVPPEAPPDDPVDSTEAGPRLLCNVEDDRLTEISGIVAGLRNPGVLWLHNDSGDKARIFAVDTNGVTLAVYQFEGVQAVDWEDITIASHEGTSFLYIADVGDNAEKREFISLYRFEEPLVDLSWRSRNFTANPERADYVYPDKAHNCEAVFVHPHSDEIYFIGKTNELSSPVFKAPWHEMQAQAAELMAVGKLPVPFASGILCRITAADISPDAESVILRTYGAALQLNAPATSTFDDIWKSEATVLQMPALIQSEALCFFHDKKRLLTTTEGSHPPIWIVTLQ